MTALSSEHRRTLESAIVEARRVAEAGCRAELGRLGIELERPTTKNEEERIQRRRLRARLRQLGGDLNLLVAEAAYEQWHRLLFARFLIDNDLLMHPDYGVPVTLSQCEGLASELGEPDGWAVAGRFAAQILPGVFRLDDPLVALRLAAEHRIPLERAVESLPPEVFVSDDGLGWVYQYWQSEAKDEVNASERKIGGADLAPVTQLFTENYMVRFLLENSLGAWWAARHPQSPLLKEWEFLRYDDDGNPAAGSFEGWPETTAEVTVMDPCCGSGHFLVEAFSMLWQMRAEEEGLDPPAAQDAVLRDNLFGLELDPRCTELAAFNLVLTAWKAGGYRQLPIPHIACSGIAAKAPLEDWTELADGDARLEAALQRLHILFRDADSLGSLIDPRRAAEMEDELGQRPLEAVEWAEVAPLLEKAAAKEADDPAAAVLGSDAAAIARAADYLSRQYTLVTTNPPFLSFNRQSPLLKRYVESTRHHARHDLAVAFLDRWWFLGTNESAATVSPSEWHILVRYEPARRRALEAGDWHLVVRLGLDAFTTTLRASPVLIVASSSIAAAGHIAYGIDASSAGTPEEKSTECRVGRLLAFDQAAQSENPDGRILITYQRSDLDLLGSFAEAHEGIRTGDSPRFDRLFWEVGDPRDRWERLQSSVSEGSHFAGRSKLILWESEDGALARFAASVAHLNHAAQNWRSGKPSWGKQGVAVSLMGDLPPTLYSGERYDMNCCAIVPHDPDWAAALWQYAYSGEYAADVRRIDQSLKLSPKTLLKVPFDLEHWTRVAEEQYPNGLPEPWSDDPTQWLFEGDPAIGTEPLQVAVARLLGYRWPEQPEETPLDAHADTDGIVCLPAVGGERPADQRLRALLADAYGDKWSPALERQLITDTGSEKKTLAEWLRDDFFKHHCKVFGNRPFIWHIRDSRKDGFSALVHYHRLDHDLLQNLTFTTLGWWIERQRADAQSNQPGAAERL